MEFSFLTCVLTSFFKSSTFSDLLALSFENGSKIGDFKKLDFFFSDPKLIFPHVNAGSDWFCIDSLPH